MATKKKKKVSVKKKVKPLNQRQELLKKIISERLGKKEPVVMGEVMREAGYSESYSLSPNQIRETKTWDEKVADAFPDDEVLKIHKGLMNSTRVEHQTYPLESPELTDEHLIELLAAVNCTVKKIVHGERSRIVFYWVANDKARKEALDMLYKLRSKYDNTVTIKTKLSTVSDSEIEDRIAGEVSAALGIIAGEGA